MTNSQESTIENAKLIVSILNELKLKSCTFTYLVDLTKILKEKGCLYPNLITTYLHRQNYIVERGGWFVFVDRKPFEYFNFICVVDRIKSKNNKSKRKSYHSYAPVREEKQQEQVKKEYSKWTKFWVKFLFKITL